MCVKDAAKLWGISERQVSKLCKEGKIKGATKQGKSWVIPEEADHRSDRRSSFEHQVKLPLPIGISDYKRASTEYYYVDKTMMIKEFLDEMPMVSLFTRPRRFGKTLNMDMFRTFFEKTEGDTSIYFKNKKIWACGEKYRSYQGKFPVIYLTFKDVKVNTWEDTLRCLSNLMANEALRHQELLQSPLLMEQEWLFLNKLIDRSLDAVDLSDSLAFLSQVLHKVHGVKPIIIIDEYDTPIQQGHIKGFYDEIIGFMRNLFSSGLKDNPHLSFGLLTGILRVAKESIFSGLNNVKINSVLDNKYSSYFGLTPEEVKEMAKYYGAENKYPQIVDWYDGYRFGDQDIFNPWSVINYFGNGCQPRAYWQATANNEIIGEILAQADDSIYEKLNSLLQGESFLTNVDTSVIYPELTRNPSSIFSFLIVTGYLKAIKTEPSFLGDMLCEVAIPNKEISFVYQKEILQKLSLIVPTPDAVCLQVAIASGDVPAFQKELSELLMQSVSYYDTMGETFYHGLVLGLCAILNTRYFITSNRESGEGRYDICLTPKISSLPGVLIELKASKECSDEALESLPQKALYQIKEKNYEEELKAKGVLTIVKYGVAFCGKRVKISKA